MPDRKKEGSCGVLGSTLEIDSSVGEYDVWEGRLLRWLRLTRTGRL